MRLKRSLFFTLILFFMIFSVSFVNASDTSTNDLDTNESMILSTVPEENILAENTEIISNGDSSSIGQTDESQNTGETENNENALILRASNDEYLANENVNDLTYGNAQILGVSNNGPVLGAPGFYIFPAIQGTYQTSEIIDKIMEFKDSGGTIYLNGQTFTGVGSYNAAAGEHVTIQNIKVHGGHPDNLDLMATFRD